MAWDAEWRESRGWAAGQQQDQGGDRAAVALALTTEEIGALRQAAGLLERLARARRATCARCKATLSVPLDEDLLAEVSELRGRLRAIAGKAARPRGATLWFGE